ncbi:HAD family hydrolase [Bacillus sp. BRMEA1]|uniref:HAD family hydrolase n=1 Tax=Neobacillus endophyticus TaxID=2738405 RepID=UPI001564EA9A|nr:HAD family hydrolase [Neobacillus endophyticus]NRD76527.1 HAD family hydrolase [Neobacillus endophyticus]
MKAIIFDFDGLIVDSESLWYEVCKEIFQEFNVHLPFEEYSKVIGTTDDFINQYFETQAGISALEAKLEEKQHKLFMERAISLSLREGVTSYLEEAKKQQLKIGLASSSGRDWVESCLKRYQIYDYFHTIKTKENVTRVKPDPSLYVKALEALEVQPNEAVAFEDSLNGSLAAIGAGIRCVIVPNPVTAHLPFENYHLRLTSMQEKSLSYVLNEIK